MSVCDETSTVSSQVQCELIKTYSAGTNIVYTSCEAGDNEREGRVGEWESGRGRMRGRVGEN